MSFTYENQGNNTYLVYKIGASDNVDTMSLGMITNNKIDGIDFQVIVEADLLVNIFEDNLDIKGIKNINERIFKTEAGKSLLEIMYINRANF